MFALWGGNLLKKKNRVFQKEVQEPAPPLLWEALKGRNSKVGTNADGRLRLRGGLYYALSGLENPNGVNSMTQAVGLGCGSPPLWG